MRREVIVAEKISGDPLKLVGQTIKKSTDLRAQGSVSEVEIIRRKGKTYYKISLFLGYDESNLREAEFNITPKTKVIDSVSIGSSIITVDTTIGFGNTGTLVSDSNIISYSDKTINQFLGCKNVTSIISKASNIRSDEYVFGYENGDLNKKVELLITGVLSNFYGPNVYGVNEGEKISVKSLGRSIDNPPTNKSYTEIFANSFIYNTSTRYFIKSFSGPTLILLSEIDKSSLKVGDSVEIVERGTQNISYTGATVQTVDIINNQVTLSNFIDFSPSASLDYDLRRILDKAKSTGAPIEYGDNKVVSDVQNLYTDDDGNYAYVASNSLPSYTITKNITYSEIPEASGIKLETSSTGYLQGFNSETLKFSVIAFNSSTKLVTGDRIVYLASNQQIPGLISGNSYFVEVLSSGNKIKLYQSRSFIGTNYYLEFDSLASNTGSHKFVLYKHRSLYISPQKLLKKFNLNPDYETGNGDKILPGGIGMLVNGVEIVSPKSDDRVYYGPLSKVEVINGGTDYDVINPPYINVSSGAGVTALVQPVVSGGVKYVYVEPQEFDIGSVVSATVTGGNGSGAILEPFVAKKYREIEFDARQTSLGGGINVSNETITFSKNHNLKDGDPVIYNNNDNNSIGIGTYLGLNAYYKTLSNGGTYYIQTVGLTTIRLYETLTDYVSGINTVGFTTENTSGVHKFITFQKDTLRAINVISPGSGYQNRKLKVKTSGISTSLNLVSFSNHNFNTGDVIRYETTGSAVGGLSTTKSYYIIKNDNDSFRLADAGIGATISSNYLRNNYVKFSSVGTGYHIFKYPDIEVSVKVSYGNTSVGIITATPLIKGKIIDAYLYEQGTGYGSTSINFEKKPIITIRNGQNAEVKPLIKNGQINSVDVLSGGSEYYSVPDIKITGDGTGAILKANILDQKLVSVSVINGGLGYTQEKTSLSVVPSGKGAILQGNVRFLEINKQIEDKTETLVETLNKLKYSFVGYSTEIFSSLLNDNGQSHSPIIGWAYDGNPIYGPYGYTNSSDNTSVSLLRSGYSIQTSSVFDRPTGFEPGYFVEDHVFTGSGDLDIHNGRVCKTPEFPKGIYAYFAGITTNVSTGKLEPTYPYFIGSSYRSRYITENSTLDQSFDFNKSNLARNTLPYKVNDQYAENDFFIESNEIIQQLSSVESVTKGSVTGFEILDAGSGYKVGDNLHFDNEGTNGGGLSADVSEITGKDIVNINTSVETYNNTVFVWKDSNTVLANILPKHTFLDSDKISISGLTSSITLLTSVHKIGVTTEFCILFKDMPSVVSPTVEDIYVSQIPSSVSIGSSLTIDNETVAVLNKFDTNSIIRVKRSSGAAHTTSAKVNVLSNSFSIPINVEYFDSKFNNKVYFNPNQSVGVGTTAGSGISTSFIIGEFTRAVSIPTQSIYLPNHPFKTGDQLTFTKPSSASALVVSNEPESTLLSLPLSGNTGTVYVINKSKDYVGLTTLVGLTTNTNGLYFQTNGSNNYEYLLETNYAQVTGKSEKITATVSVSTSHQMINGDIITLDVKPNTTVGFGTTSVIDVRYNPFIDKIVFNPIGFTSANVNTLNSTISIGASHLNTGDKVFYTASDEVASGLVTSTYFVYKVDDNTIKLAETYEDTIHNYPLTVPIIGIGGSQQQLQIINPPLKVQKNSDLKFNVSHPSLSGYKLKLFFDNDYNNEFVSVANTTTFNVLEIGTVGSGTTSSLTLRYSDDLPQNLFYALEKSGFISTADKEVKNYSKIEFVNSDYDGKYTVFGVGNTTFSVSLSKVPNETYVSSSNTDILKYSTTSLTASGGIKKIKNIFGGANYKSLPGFSSITSDNGTNANIIATSEKIGRINKVKILEQGFEYSCDKTLRPDAYVSPNYYLSNSNTIESITVIDGGKNYSVPPNLLIVDPITGNVTNRDSLTCSLDSGTSISSVNIVYQPKGLPFTQQNIIAIDNSNGVGINSVMSSSAGVVTCFLTTPLTGFTTSVFSIGDEIFVENIEKNTSSGTGFNSADYGYRFFTVTNYVQSNPARLEYSLAGLTNNAGLAKTEQNSYAFIVNKKNYPVFAPIQKFSTFLLNEQILVKPLNGNQFVEKDLYVQYSDKDLVKFIGTYTRIKVGDTIQGKNSGVIATISDIEDKNAKFNVDYAIENNSGWATDTGKLNVSSQVSSDNDYYQNMSYSVKSKIQYVDMVNSVNRLLHPTGMKNFSDTQVNSKPDSRVSYASSTNDVIVLDITNENRVDTVNYFDNVVDFDTSGSRSKFLKFQNKKLTDFVSCNTNRVLLIDDISGEFQNSRSTLKPYAYLDFINQSFSKYLYQIVDNDQRTRQIGEVVALYTNDNIYNLSKSLLASGITTTSQTVVGEVVADKDSFDIASLRFIPIDPYDQDYDIKILKTSFNTDLSGIGTQSVGFIDLVGVNTSVGSGTTTTVFSASAEKTKALFVNAQLIDNVTKEMNYVEMYIDHDGTDTYTTEYYFDTNSGVSTNYIGVFQPTISFGSLRLNYYNDTSTQVLVRSRIVGFGTTSVGIGTYRFLSSGQISGNERSAYYESRYNVSSASTSVVDVNTENVLSVKSTIKVSYGNTSSLHQVLMSYDGVDTNVVQYPFLSVGSTTGIGTFGGKVDGTKAVLSFYPDSNVLSNVLVQSFNEILYSTNDYDNEAPSLNYGSVEDSIKLSQYSGFNGARVNKKSFDLKYEGTPIFSKTFNPSNTAILNPITGLFQIENHFFSTGEKLTYIPGSTLIGVGASSVGIGSTATSISGGVGIGTTDILPSTVYAIKNDNNTFKLATTPQYAAAGIAVTFTSSGLGNAHKLIMAKRNEKSIITIDGVIQKPLTYTPLSYNLSNNGGQIGTGSTIFALSGISSIRPRDILKIDNEYMDVISVGLGTTSIGPISGTGTFSIVSTSRGSVGSSATYHNDGTEVRVYRGSYNIENSTIFFTDAPYGNGGIEIDLDTNLAFVRSTFDGRVFLRQNYSTNYIYDDISDNFSGIGRSFSLTVQGINTTGVTTTSILLINDLFQTPTTENNVGNNYQITVPSSTGGISTVTFTGITSTNSDIIVSDYDVNQNQIPRGGVIISLGSTNGLGFAPLIGAAVTAVLGGGGGISTVGVGSTDIVGSGYYGVVSIGVTDPNHTGTEALISAQVGAGGTLTFIVNSAGSGYVNPRILVPEPTYSNLPVIGVSRFGVGPTTDTGSSLLVSLDVGASSTTGIGSTLFEVQSFEISRPGYGFRIGDVFKPVGLVTAKGLAAPLADFELTVLDIFTDSFASWQVGDLDLIDPIKLLQDGSRQRFPLYYNSQLLSFEKDPRNPDSVNIDLNTVLLVFRNGVIQRPGDAYIYDGGTSIRFTEAPKPEDNMSIFFYRGTTGIDARQIDINETIKIGDDIQVLHNDSYSETKDQEMRRVDDIPGFDRIETSIYTGAGIDENNYKPLFWTKQKVDKTINGDFIYKSRDSIEGQIYPTSKVIKNVSSTDNEIFVDDVQLFDYERDVSGTPISGFSVLLVQDSGLVSAGATAIVSAAGTISSLSITNAGAGYTSGSSITVKIAAPRRIGVGIGTTATATVSVSVGGTITSPLIINPGFGYSQSAPPSVIIESPLPKIETITEISSSEIMGFSGIITGITTTTGTGSHPLALKLFLNATVSATPFTNLSVGYPIFVSETSVGSGVTSVDNLEVDVVGIGTTFVDNIYYVHSISASGQNAEVITNISSGTIYTGINTVGTSSTICGRFSWGRLFNVTRSSSPVSIGVTGLDVNSGLSSFPTIQRRGYGLRNKGPLKKTFG